MSVTRRGFMAAGALLLAWGCGAPGGPGTPVATGSSAPASPDASPQAAAPVDDFLALSALLTGVPAASLDPALGRAIQEGFSKPRPFTIPDLLKRAGFEGGRGPATLADLGPVFEEEDSRRLADEVTVAWYTGVVPGEGGPKVAGYVTTLQWKALGYGGAPSVCHGGWWDAPA